jgi:predicted peptidase
MRTCGIFLSMLLYYTLLSNNTYAQSSIVNEFMFLSHTYKGLTIPYRLYMPSNYNPSKKYPIILSLHGAGENGTDNIKTLTSTSLATYWAEKKIQAKHPCFVVVPQLPKNLLWYQWMFMDDPNGDYLEAANSIIDALIKQYSNIDNDRLYAIGFSMGGVACWELVSKYQKRFAAIVPISGSTLNINTDSIKTTPVWIFSGKMDDIFDAQIYYHFATEVITSGHSVVFPQSRFGVYSATDRLSLETLKDSIEKGATFLYTEYSDLGHSTTVTERAYQDLLLAEWLFMQKKNVVASIEKDNNEIPGEFSLSQNYPNPFNPSTVINYRLAKPSNASLKVYNLLGMEVVVLVNGYQQAGIYNYQFSIQNSQWPSGVYFYTLRTDNYSSTKKMVLMK